MLSCFEIFGPACFNKVQLLFWRKFKYFDTLNGKKAALFPWSLLALQFWWLKLQRKLPICYSVVFLLRQVAFIGLADKRLHEIPLYLKNPIFVTVGQPFSLFHISHTVLHKVPFFFLSTNINFYAKWLLWKKLSLVCWLPLAVLETQGRHSICTEESVALQIFLTLNMSLSHP